MVRTPPTAVSIEVGVQSDSVARRTVGVMSDVSCVELVCETLYVSVASQTCDEMLFTTGGRDIEMRRLARSFGASTSPNCPCCSCCT